MRRLIANDIFECNIQINYEAYEEELEVAAGKVIDFSNNKGEIIDDEAFKEFENFVNDVRNILVNEFNCKVVYDTQSAKSASTYISFFNEEYDKGFATLFDLRVSDHILKKKYERVRKDKTKQKKKLPEVQEVASPNVKYALMGIVVNGQTVNTYEQALDKMRMILNNTFLQLQNNTLQYPKQ